mmetsp:Transcript_17674/g.34453  ORF Transcript_17674/g.34453 Transcript_17674/m.34453 type:complete len:223 (+) Transcript_17674:633-1301(+)
MKSPRCSSMIHAELKTRSVVIAYEPVDTLFWLVVLSNSFKGAPATMQQVRPRTQRMLNVTPHAEPPNHHGTRAYIRANQLINVPREKQRRSWATISVVQVDARLKHVPDTNTRRGMCQCCTAKTLLLMWASNIGLLSDIMRITRQTKRHMSKYAKRGLWLPSCCSCSCKASFCCFCESSACSMANMEATGPAAKLVINAIQAHTGAPANSLSVNGSSGMKTG